MALAVAVDASIVATTVSVEATTQSNLRNTVPRERWGTSAPVYTAGRATRQAKDLSRTPLHERCPKRCPATISNPAGTSLPARFRRRRLTGKERVRHQLRTPAQLC